MLRKCPLESRGPQPVVPAHKQIRLWTILEVLTATTMKMEVPGFTETLVTYQTGRCRVPEENSLRIAILWFIAPRMLCLKL